MTENAAKRVTKWDLAGEAYLSTKISKDSALSEKAVDTRHVNESNLEWNTLKTAGNRVRKWSDLEANNTMISKDSSQRSYWDPVSRVKCERKDTVNRGHDEILQTARTWEGDQSDSTSVSPGLDAWRQRSRSRSPKSGWSRPCRSRSKSPSHGNKSEEEGWNDRSRGRFFRRYSHEYDGGRHDDGSPTYNGRGRHRRRGLSWHSSYENFTESHEQRGYSRDKLSHRSNYDGDREKHDLHKNRSSVRCNNFTRGKCYRGSACKFAHHDVSADGYGGWSMKDAARESSHDKRDMDQRDECRRTSNIPCKYFAEGRCRNGEHCRFSHQGRGPDSPEGMSRDKWGPSLDNNNRSWGGRKWSDKADGQDVPNLSHWSDQNGGKLGFPERSCDDGWGHSLENENRPWGGPKWGDKVAIRGSPKSSRWGDDNGAKISIPESGAAEGSRDDKWGASLDKEKRSWGGPTWGNKADGQDVLNSSQRGDNNGAKMCVPESRAAVGSHDDKWCHNLDKGGSKWMDKAACQDVSISTKSTDNNDAKGGITDSWETGRSSDDRRDHCSHSENKSWGAPKCSDKAAGRCIPNSSQWRDDDGAKTGFPESRATEKFLNVTGKPSTQNDREENLDIMNDTESEHTPQDFQSRNPKREPKESTDSVLPSQGQDMIQGISGQQRPPVSPVLMQSGVSENAYIQQHHDCAKSHYEINFSENNPPAVVLFPGQGVNQDGCQHIAPLQTSSVKSSNLNGQSQQISSHSSSIQPEIVDAKISHTNSDMMTQNVVTSDQVAQMTNLSASLAQIFGNGQQLPQVYASLGPTDSTGQLVPSQSNSASLIPMASVFIQPDQGSLSQMHYHLIRVSMEPRMLDDSDQPPGFSSISVEHKSTAIEESHTPLNRPAPSSVSGRHNDGSEGKPYNENPKFKPFDLNKVTVAEEEGGNGQSKKEQEAGHSEDMGVDNPVDKEIKRSEDTKGMRMFKFALVEFIKEILKPSWKEGQVSREAHRTIVKKVVDKVTGTIQGPHIPQTEEKIDQYLSHSKPKLTKLVQAYVERYVKSRDDA